jgi:hypothetical protein
VPARAPDPAVARSAGELLEELNGFGGALAEVAAEGERLDHELGELVEPSRVRASVEELEEDVQGTGELLTSRCETLHSRHQLALTSTAGDLLALAARLLQPSALDVIATELASAGIRLRDKCDDRIAALERRAGEARREFARALAACVRDTTARGADLRPGVERALSQAGERVDHLGAVIDAKDFSRQGLVLVADAHGHG